MSLGLFFWVMFLPITIVWVLLVWNSAYRTRFFLTIVARAAACILLAVVIFESWSLVPVIKDSLSELRGDPQFGARIVTVSSNGKALEIDGFISASVATDVKKALMDHPQIGEVRLDSVGGRVSAAQKIAILIKSRKMDTMVYSECSSACIIPLMAGRNRIIYRSARIGFHAPAIGDEIATEQRNMIKREVVEAGIEKHFADRAYADSTVWYPTIEELRAARVVTEIR